MLKTYATIIDGEALEAIKQHAANAWINGKSHIRTSDREDFGPEDQLIGQLGEYAIARFFDQTESYFERRREIDLTPREGDGGSDLIGYSIDVKTSLMRKSQDPFSYNLLVRPRERHKRNAYVLALVQGVDTHKVVLVGYATDAELPSSPESSGVFAGAFRIPAKNLHDVGELRSKVVVV